MALPAVPEGGCAPLRAGPGGFGRAGPSFIPMFSVVKR